MVKRFTVTSAKSFINIVLVEPEIPQNTGNIGRLCVGMNAALHLIKPFGFELDDKQLKRAGLDYWPHLDVHIYDDFDHWFSQVKDKTRMFLFTTKVKKAFYEIEYQQGDWLVFGKETKGLKESLLAEHTNQCVTIPFTGEIRSFNLANAVAMSLGESVRQLKYQPGQGS